MYPTLFESFLNPPTIVVVSEERLKEAEKKQRTRQLAAVIERIEQLTEYRTSLEKELEPQSLEEALLGE